MFQIYNNYMKFEREKERTRERESMSVYKYIVLALFNEGNELIVS